MTTHNLARAGVMTVPATIVTQTLDTAKLVITNIRPYARNFRIATKEMEISLMTSHGVVSAAYEGGTLSEDETAAFGSKVGHLHKYYHRFHLTHEMLKFGYAGLLPMLKKDQGKAFSKKLGTAHVSGTGAGEPEGVLTNGSIPTVNLEETTSITTGDWLSYGYHYLKEDYADQARWMMKRLTMWELSILKGSDGHPLIVQLRDKPDFLFMGAPIIQSPDMPAMASGAKPIMLADFNSLYGTIDWTGTTIKIEDPFSSKSEGIVEYLTVMWFGGFVLIPEAGVIFVASVT
jgi:HK97 family phage major capsid protein